MIAFYRRALPTAIVLLAPMLIVAGIIWRLDARKATHLQRSSQAVIGSSPLAAKDWNDRFGDGTPDFLAAYRPRRPGCLPPLVYADRRYQAIRPEERTAGRDRRLRQPAALFLSRGPQAPQRVMVSGDRHRDAAPPGEIRAWHYPRYAAGRGAVSGAPGAFEPADVTNGALRSLPTPKRWSSAMPTSSAATCGRPARRPAFFRQFGQSSPWHSMIVDRSRSARRGWFITPATGSRGQPGELRRVLLSELLDHPQPQWRPVAQQPQLSRRLSLEYLARKPMRFRSSLLAASFLLLLLFRRAGRRQGRAALVSRSRPRAPLRRARA